MANPTAGPAAESAALAAKRTKRRSPRTWGLRVGESVTVAILALFGARFGLWFAPFAAAFALCAFRRSRGTVLAVIVGAMIGWAGELWFFALWSGSPVTQAGGPAGSISHLSGVPVNATARTIASLAGLPPYAAVTYAVLLLLAALQAATGAWLAIAIHFVLPARLRRMP